MKDVSKLKDAMKKVLKEHGGTIFERAGYLVSTRYQYPIIKKEKELIRIDPVYYDTIEEAVEAFKELSKTTNHAVMCGGGDGKSYGVFDESILLE